MQIPRGSIFHPRNPGGEVRIDNCYRVGKKNQTYPRPVIVTMLTQIAKQIITDRTYLKNLTQSSKIRITQRYQSEIRERRQTQVDTFKTLKEQRKETGERINLVNDKIMNIKTIILN